MASDSMNFCSCGNAIDQDDTQCGRCTALQALGLDARADHEDVERTYRILVKVWHPDRFQSDPKVRAEADEKLKSINAAYSYLNSEAGQKRGTPPPDAERSEEPRAEGASGANTVALGAQKADKRTATASSLLLRLMMLACVLIVMAVVLLGADSYLSTNAQTAGSYARFKSQMLYGLAVAKNNALNGFEGKWRRKDSSPASPPAATQGDEGRAEASAQGKDANPNAPVPVNMPTIKMPYVTVGLTRDEVAGVMGMPVSSTESEMAYHGAHFYLHNNAVVGWRIDSPAELQHVRLFPNGHVDPALRTFTFGSSRNDVIAVQGTPTLLTENKLAYGGSEVFLEGGRVVGWNDNHASTRLRVASRQ